jgi:hypothetical protein
MSIAPVNPSSDNTTDLAFEYEPLDSSLSTTRLVILYPPSSSSSPSPSSSSSSTHDTIRCNIQQVNLNDKPKYAALSYLWGTQDLVVPILVNGKKFMVTQNLGNALKHIRHRTKIMMVWVDSISINQRDKIEKGTHVLRMARIYSQAAVVLSWLGTSEDDRDLALMKMFQIRQSISLKPFNWIGNTSYPSPCFQGLYEARLVDLDGIMSLPDKYSTSSTMDWDIKDRITSSIVNVLGLRYWKRVWVQQELLLARQVIFVCGDHDIDEPTFKEASSLQHLEVLPSRAETQARLLEVQRIHCWPLQLQHTLKELLFNATYRRQDTSADLFEASDERDNIYGFISMAKDARDLDICPNYSNAKGWEAVCQDVAVAYMKIGDVDILSYAGLRRSPRVSASWVVDWSADWNRRPGLTDGLSRALYPLIHAASSICVQGLYSATKGRRCEYTVSEALNQLEISGIEIGTVSYVEKSPDRLTKPMIDMQTLIRNWIQPSSNDLYGSENKAKEAALRSLVVDIGHSTMSSGPIGTDPRNLRWHARCDLLSTLDLLLSDKYMDKKALEPYEKAFRLFARQRPRIATKNGYIGLGPWDTEQGDVVCLLFGGSTPFVLRKSVNETFKLVGDAYIHGVMDGELMHSDLRKRQFKLV